MQVDGQLKTGRDVVVAALLGAEEFGFATAPLVVMGCVMMRVCHLNTCPVGIATQDPELRKTFTGTPEFVQTFFRFIADEVRELMAELGFRTLDEMVGRADCLDFAPATDHWKASGLDLSPLLHQPALAPDAARRAHASPGRTAWHARARPARSSPGPPRALERQAPVELTLPIRNTDRTTGTLLGYEVTDALRRRRPARRHHPRQLHRLRRSELRRVPAARHHAHARGRGQRLRGQGPVGRPDRRAAAARGPRSSPKRTSSSATSPLYGATSGEAFVRGVAGERFAVRNSGARAVVEGVGDHGCEYMTGGRVVVLGRTGRNFAAGMSGGIAYVLDDDGTLRARCNTAMVDLERLDDEDESNLRARAHRAPRGADRQRRSARACSTSWPSSGSAPSWPSCRATSSACARPRRRQRRGCTRQASDGSLVGA